MRVQIFTVLLLSAFLGVMLLATGCMSVPMASAVKLSRIDFQTTDLSVLRAAVLLPSYLRPSPDGVWLQVVVSSNDGPTLARKLALVEVDDPEAATINVEDGGSGQIYAFELSASGVRTLGQLRRTAHRAKQRGSKGSLSIGVSADACRTRAIPAGPVRITTYLKTAETQSFVPLVRDIDLRTAMPDGPFELKPCPHVLP